MSPKLMSLFENSPAWKYATKEINGVVERCNAQNMKISEEHREEMREARILFVIASDPEVYQAVADEVWEINRRAQ